LPLNYTKVKILKDSNNQVTGVQVKNQETGELFDLKGKAVINATGIHQCNKAKRYCLQKNTLQVKESTLF
jgi:glycerol-3-phosphate dehydrogenase